MDSLPSVLCRPGIACGQTYYPGTKETHVGQAFPPDSESCQAGKPDLLPCRDNIAPEGEAVIQQADEDNHTRRDRCREAPGGRRGAAADAAGGTGNPGG